MKIHWKGTNFASSVVRNSLFQLTMWVAFFPGFYSADSFAAVEMARTGQLTNSYTAIWALYLRIFSLHGHAIGLLTLINSLILVYAITTFTYSIFNSKTAALTSFIITLTPTVWAMGITLWHDILMTSGLLLVVSFFNLYLKTENYDKKQLYLNLIFGSLLTAFRPNGLPTLIFFSFLLYLFKRKKQVLNLVTVTVLASGLITFLTSQILLGLSPINSYYAQEWMRSDISCYAYSPEGKGFVEKNIPAIGSTMIWASKSACTFLNSSQLSSKEKIKSEKYVPNAWLKLFQQDTSFVIATHLHRNSYLLPVPIYGIPNEPFLHSTIEFKDLGVNWKWPVLAEKLRLPIRLWNALRGITGWAGLWIILMLLSKLLCNNLKISATAAMTVSLFSILIVVAPISEGRYVLYILSTCQIILLGSIAERILSIRSRRDKT